MREPTFITRVLLENYRSIARCDVQLGPLTFLVGENGAGKSNFLDALRFVADALRTSLDHAIRDRGGIREIRLRSRTHPTQFGARLEFALSSGQRGYYAYRIGSLSEGRYEVQKEDCWIAPAQALAPSASYSVRSGSLSSASAKVMPAVVSDRLYLVNASGLPEFRPLYEALSNMGFYNLNPDRIRDLQPSDTGELLTRDGSNIASVMGQLTSHAPAAKQRIEEYLSKIVSGIRQVEAKPIGTKETLEFGQQMAGSKNLWRFLAANMSDGTLRALGVLVALFQSANGQRQKVPLVGIEEPEIALHPAAAGVLLDAIREASRRTQVLVTSHSPELLDDDKIGGDAILAVLVDQGLTRIGPLDEVGISALRDRLYTPGELLRLNQLTPDPRSVHVDTAQLDLFAGMSE